MPRHKSVRGRRACDPSTFRPSTTATRRPVSSSSIATADECSSTRGARRSKLGTIRGAEPFGSRGPARDRRHEAVVGEQHTLVRRETLLQVRRVDAVEGRQAEYAGGLRIMSCNVVVTQWPAAVRHPRARLENRWIERHAASSPQVAAAAEETHSGHVARTPRVTRRFEAVQRHRVSASKVKPPLSVYAPPTGAPELGRERDPGRAGAYDADVSSTARPAGYSRPSMMLTFDFFSGYCAWWTHQPSILSA